MKRLIALAVLLAATQVFAQPVELEIKEGDSVVSALVFGRGGEHTVISLHGAGGHKGNFRPIAPGLAKRGFKIIAIDWQAGSSGPAPGMGPLAATVRYARQSGAKKVSLMGHSRGGELVSRYASAQPDGEFDTVILLASYDDQAIPLAKTKKLFVFHDNDRFGRWSQLSADRSSEPKLVFALKGVAHSIAALLADKPDLIEEIAALLSK